MASLRVLVAPIMYLLVFVLRVWSAVWVVVCALWALIVYYVYVFLCMCMLRTVVLIKVLVDTRATGCITQQLTS
jgi:hypothetical protein